MNQVPLGQMAPIAHPLVDLFLLGFIAGCSLVAVLFFLRFWRDTRDTLFIGFAVFFLIQGCIDVLALAKSQPNVASPWIFCLHFASTLAVLLVILWKNA
jgi:uncharacterized membrane protein HdeD (DUF308 family)